MHPFFRRKKTLTKLQGYQKYIARSPDYTILLVFIQEWRKNATKIAFLPKAKEMKDFTFVMIWLVV